jgi:hypothetical protein
MKKFMAILLIAFAVYGLFAENTATADRLQPTIFSASGSRDDVVIYEETFETEDNGWVHYDGTLPASMWHLDDATPFGGAGYSWFMGDPALGDIGGYIDHLYVVLDTPEINVPAGGHLTFKLTYNCELPDGATAPYDGWDGSNVRISTDGTTWTPISGTPAYNCDSMYGFGFEHNEGPDVPGWGGVSDGWVDADFDLSAYAGQDVQIRFAFASDPSYSTAQQSDMFGMMVDNIELGDYSYDYNDNDEHEMTYTSVVPVGGDIWYWGEPGDAPSPTHAMICQNDQGTYNTGMIDYLESPTITLPATGEIKADFMIKGGFLDPDTFPEVDFFGWEVSPDNGTTWHYMSNPGADPNGDNYVYSDAPDIWSSMVDSYTLLGRLDDLDGMYEGQDVKFRIFFQTDDDDPDGIGIMIDNFTVINTTFPGPAPENLVGVYNLPNVDLTWDPIQTGGGEGWIHWDDGANSDNYIGTASATIIDAAARFTSTDLLAYEGGAVTSIKFFPGEAACDYAVRIWDESGANVLYEQAVTDPVMNAWNEVTLDTPMVLASGTEYWFGYRADTTTGHPCGVDIGPMVADRGGYIRQNDGAWAQLAGYDLDFNWNIQTYVTGADGEPIIVEPTLNREVTGYNVFRSDITGGPYELLGTTDSETTAYTDTDPIGGVDNYYVVTALYDGADGSYSEEAVVYVINPSAGILAYDDGTAESGFNVGSANTMAVKFTPGYDGEDVSVTHLQVYVYEFGTGQMIIKLWNNNGGIPGDQLAQFVYPSTGLTVGWNTIEIPAPPSFTEGSFFIGIFEMAGLSAIGFDEDNSGRSYTHSAAGGWVAEGTGSIMFRAVVDPFTPTDADDVISPVKYSLSNHPNPFNPTTNISFNVPEKTNASITIYNVKGQEVVTLLDEEVAAGNTTVTWNGKDNSNNAVTSGIYFYKLETAGKSLTKKMIMLK